MGRPELQANFNPTHTFFILYKDNKFKIRNNFLASRLTILNWKIELIDLNLSLSSFKIKYKNLLLSSWGRSATYQSCIKFLNYVAYNL